MHVTDEFGNYRSNVIRFWPYCCSFYTTYNCWFNYRFYVIWVLSYCCNSDISSIWPCWSSTLYVLQVVSTPLFMWLHMHTLENRLLVKKKSCSKVYSTTSLSRLSFPPLRFIGSFATLLLDGPTPSVAPLFSSSSKIYGFGDMKKGHIQIMA